MSSLLFDGNFGGLTGADQYCKQMAEAAGLRGDWTAWLSDMRLSAGTRIPASADPYVMVDGTRVAANFDVFRTCQCTGDSSSATSTRSPLPCSDRSRAMSKRNRLRRARHAIRPPRRDP